MRQIEYGVIATRERINTVLPKTLWSLADAGFQQPHLFVDGVSCLTEICTPELTELYHPLVKVTLRGKQIGGFGNWLLAAWELYIRNPKVEYYLLFEDDIIVCKGLREYLGKCSFPSGNFFLNLYTEPRNEKLVLKKDPNPINGWHLSDQMGRGALGLLFARRFLLRLLTTERFYIHPEKPRASGAKRGLDGAISRAVRDLHGKEYIHYPSLLQHRDCLSIQTNIDKKRPESFPGENYNVLELLPCMEVNQN